MSCYASDKGSVCYYEQQTEKRINDSRKLVKIVDRTRKEY